MNNNEFIYWLQGMLEYTDVPTLSEAYAKTLLKGVQDHLKLVLKKVTPQINPVVNPGIPRIVPQPNHWPTPAKDIGPYDHKYFLDQYLKHQPIEPLKYDTGKFGELIC